MQSPVIGSVGDFVIACAERLSVMGNVQEMQCLDILILLVPADLHKRDINSVELYATLREIHSFLEVTEEDYNSSSFESWESFSKKAHFDYAIGLLAKTVVIECHCDEHMEVYLPHLSICSQHMTHAIHFVATIILASVREGSFLTNYRNLCSSTEEYEITYQIPAVILGIINVHTLPQDLKADFLHTFSQTFGSVQPSDDTACEWARQWKREHFISTRQTEIANH